MKAHEREVADDDARGQLAQHCRELQALEQRAAEPREHEDQGQRLEHGQHVDGARTAVASGRERGVGEEQPERDEWQEWSGAAKAKHDGKGYSSPWCSSSGPILARPRWPTRGFPLRAMLSPLAVRWIGRSS